MNAGFSRPPPPSDGVFVWSLSESEGEEGEEGGVARVESGCVGVSEAAAVAGGSVASFVGFVFTGRSLGTWKQR